MGIENFTSDGSHFKVEKWRDNDGAHVNRDEKLWCYVISKGNGWQQWVYNILCRRRCPRAVVYTLKKSAENQLGEKKKQKKLLAQSRLCRTTVTHNIMYRIIMSYEAGGKKTPLYTSHDIDYNIRSRVYCMYIYIYSYIFKTNTHIYICLNIYIYNVFTQKYIL